MSTRPAHSRFSVARRSFLGVWLATAFAPAAPPCFGAEPSRLPVVPLVNLDGTRGDIDMWLGRPLVLNIWATWCAPCRSEMPSLQRLEALVAPAGIRVVALSLDTDRNLVREFVLKYGLGFPVGIAAAPHEAGPLLGAAALPLTLYVDADGRIAGRHLGAREWSDAAAVQEVRRKLLPSARR